MAFCTTAAEYADNVVVQFFAILHEGKGRRLKYKGKDCAKTHVQVYLLRGMSLQLWRHCMWTFFIRNISVDETTSARTCRKVYMRFPSKYLCFNKINDYYDSSHFSPYNLIFMPTAWNGVISNHCLHTVQAQLWPCYFS